jgi:hypothetical protein
MALALVTGCGPDAAFDGETGTETSGADSTSNGDDSGVKCPELVLDSSLIAGSIDDTIDVPPYTHVTGSAGAYQVPGLEDLEFLRCLRSAGRGLSVTHNPDLKSLKGLERLESVGRLKVYENSGQFRVRVVSTLRQPASKPRTDRITKPRRRPSCAVQGVNVPKWQFGSAGRATPRGGRSRPSAWARSGTRSPRPAAAP